METRLALGKEKGEERNGVRRRGEVNDRVREKKRRREMCLDVILGLKNRSGDDEMREEDEEKRIKGEKK